MAKKKMADIEIVTVALNGRTRADLLEAVNNRMEELGHVRGDFGSLDLGFELDKKFLMLNGPQPTLAQLTVLCNKLELRLQISHLEMVPPGE